MRERTNESSSRVVIPSATSFSVSWRVSARRAPDARIPAISFSFFSRIMAPLFPGLVLLLVPGLVFLLFLDDAGERVLGLGPERFLDDLPRILALAGGYRHLALGDDPLFHAQLRGDDIAQHLARVQERYLFRCGDIADEGARDGDLARLDVRLHFPGRTDDELVIRADVALELSFDHDRAVHVEPAL